MLNWTDVFTPMFERYEVIPDTFAVANQYQEFDAKVLELMKKPMYSYHWSDRPFIANLNVLQTESKSNQQTISAILA